MKRNISIPATAMGMALLSLSFLTSCDKEQLITDSYPQAYPTTQINFIVSDELPLAVGMDSTIVYTVGPESASDKTIIFSSSNPEVATVDQNGKISAIKVGEATISAVPTIGFGADAAILVKVIDQVVKATSMTIECVTEASDEGYFYETDQLQLVNHILPENATYSYVTWTSENKEVASVDENGMVSCLKEGDAWIRCHTHDHSNVAGDYKFHVYKMQEVDHLDITPLDGSICINQGDVKLDVTYYPQGATVGSVVWESSDPTVVDVKRGILSPKGWGTATITATCPSGNKTSIEVTVENGLYIWNAANGWSNWICSNDQAAEERGEFWRIHFPDAGSGKWRRDIKINCDNNNMFPMHKERPVLALKTNLQKGGNNTWDVRDSGTPKDNNGYDLPDGNRLIMIDLTAKFAEWGEEIHYFNLFQLKVADIPNGNVDPNSAYYDIFWIRTFKTADEAKAFGDAEALGK